MGSENDIYGSEGAALQDTMSQSRVSFRLIHRTVLQNQKTPPRVLCWLGPVTPLAKEYILSCSDGGQLDDHIDTYLKAVTSEDAQTFHDE